MESRNPGFLALPILALVIVAIFFTGCVGNGGDTTPTTQSISVTGSTTVLPIAQMAAEAFMDANTYADIQVSGGGSSVGVQAVGEGTADIGMASRDLKDSEKEKYPDLVQHIVARDGIAIIVHPSNSVDVLTEDQVKSIYLGDITRWNAVGGSDQAIVVVGRDSASGTREFFHESVMDREDFTPNQLEKNSNGAIQQTIAQTPGAIGYVGLGYIDDTIKAVKIDVDGTQVTPSVETVVAGEYPIARSLNMFTKGQPTGLAQDYLDSIMSAGGQAIVADEGFVPVK
ncbi:phosphate ABC transporter substrate-binding protein [Methanofollis fontis]|uniref:Phosphate-binding protein n=1 Tax=Methanofollis fontis TaxID=2052832 RepID=A0A483CXK8_9EURY|nr:phosphate ABC transporter substrate-binding protein [Methanofollis fontis]TAJ44043.1 phosphate-binding protein [Methanofollis fontis]